MRIVKVVHASTGNPVGDRIVCADTSLTRLFGLLPKSSLCSGEGLWITPSSGVHTFGMRFPIDVVALDRSMHVVALWANLKPFRVTAIHRRTHSVLELAAGEIRVRSLAVGDRLELVGQPTKLQNTPVTITG